EIDQTSDEIMFPNPQTVSFDDRGNIYVVDDTGARVVTFPQNMPAQVFPIAQPGSIGEAAGISVTGTNVFVIDDVAVSDAQSVKRVTVGAPQILSMSRNFDRLEGGSVVVITGKNFAPESVVVIGDSVVNATIESATSIRFTVPPLGAPGKRTLSILTRGGVAQSEFRIMVKSLDEIFDGEITTIAGGVPFIGDGGD